MNGQKLTVEELTIGKTMEATFWPNPAEDSRFKFRATHLDGRRAPKVVLCNDARIVAGAPCLVRVVAIRKPERDDRGHIEVEFVRPAPFRIEGVYLDPIVSKKLQVLLESGLNILLDGPQGCGKTVLARSIAEQPRHGVRVLQLRRGRRGDRLPRDDPGARLRERRAGHRLRQDRHPGRAGGRQPARRRSATSSSSTSSTAARRARATR